MNESPPFIIVKFLSTDDDEDEYYEIALTKWLIDLDENMIGNIFWPEDNFVTETLVQTQANAQLYWFTHAIEVKRYYDTYFQARKGLTEIREHISGCETDIGKEMGRRKRKKESTQIEFSDESDNDQDIKNQFMTKKSSISSPSVSHVPEVFIPVDKNSDHKYKRNVNQDSSSIKNLKVARYQDELTSENIRKNLLKKRISKRKKIVKEAEKKKDVLLTAHSQQSIKSSVNTAFNNFIELCDKTEIETKEEIEEPNSFTSCAVSSKTSSCTSEKQIFIVSSTNMSNISRTSDDSLENPQKSSVLNLKSEEYNQINPLSHSLMKDTSLDVQSVQKENLLFSRTKRQFDSSVCNLTDNINALDFNLHFKTLEKKLDDINSKLDMIIMNQEQLNKGLLPKQAIITRPPNLPTLPLDDIKGLEAFEKFISEEVNLSATCYYMKTFPLGNNEKTATLKLMAKLMTNSLALHFNFDGQNTQKALKIKRPFKKLKLWELVQGVMQLKFPASDLSETLNAVRSWLRNAAGRKL
ncbi:uncharacterized protein LOC105197192 isoform X1 [Solenopsis invicta]|uniref:uncharacterized protein LOC105197192 isoform X1 n=3 Tax=Solenopsis invicta TaxID=13686 RepID=UPI000595F14E|nr:uncharacterized protein LOC105197192 isoform X1 [Solenopsis invicta]